MMGKLDAFLSRLINYDKENISQEIINEIYNKYLTNEEFHGEIVAKKSEAAAGKYSVTDNECLSRNCTCSSLYLLIEIGDLYFL